MLRWWRALTPEGTLVMLNLGTVVVSVALWLVAAAFEAVMAPSPRPVVQSPACTVMRDEECLEDQTAIDNAYSELVDSTLAPVTVPQAEIVEP